MISRLPASNNNTIKKGIRSHFSHKVIRYWNLLPTYCKTSISVNNFKANLELFKKRNCHVADSGNFWEVSDLVLSKIEGPSYLQNKISHNKYLMANSAVARRKGFNTFMAIVD